MCMIANPVVDVKNTKIFVDVKGTTCITFYSMEVETKQKNAMILPVPPTGDIQLLDLSGKEVKEVLKAFHEEFSPTRYSRTFSLNKSAEKNYVPVVRVGSYKVSIANTISDLDRLDPSVFQISPEFNSVLVKNYSIGFKFVVAILAGTGKNEFHPLGYTYPMYMKGAFVPLRHYHAHEHKELTHDFDHEIYFGFPIRSQGTTKTVHPTSISSLLLRKIYRENGIDGKIEEKMSCLRLRGADVPNVDLIADV